MTGSEFLVDFPTLGDLGDGWIKQHCRVPDGFLRGRPFELADWQFWCTANRYRIRPDAVFVPPDEVGPGSPALLSQAFHYQQTLIVAPQKALALDTPIPTPSGWTTMGAVDVGDLVFDEQGQPTAVLSKSAVWISETYRVSFSDGSSLVACKDHQWWVQRRTKSGTYVEDRVRTEDLVGELVDSGGARRFRVPNARPLQLPDADLPVPPYTLGAWLGDGHADDGRITGLDDGVFDRIKQDGFEVRRGSVQKRRSVIGLRPLLRRCGVLRSKHVPAEYLRASLEQRWALLQGLMDTDGHADERQGKCEFTTVLPALRDGMLELLRSLGIRPVCYEGQAALNGVVTGPKWRIFFAARSDMPVFGLARKQGRLKTPGRGHAQHEHRRIVSVDPVEPVPTQCLTVAAPSHVFLAGEDMIPTCNTGKGPNSAASIAFEAAGPSVFGGWAKQGDVYDCGDHGCSCGWVWEYQPGEPMGIRHPSPLVQITSFSEDAADNIYRPLRAMIQLGPLKQLLAVREGFIRVLGLSGVDDLDRIDVVTASANSRLGNPISDAEQDEAGVYTKANKMLSVADTQNRGATAMGGRTHLTTNAWDPSERSYAQLVYEAASPDTFIFFRNPDLALRDDKGLRLNYLRKDDRRRIHEYVYAGSWWVNLEAIEGLALKLIARDPQQAARFFGNRLEQGLGAWLSDNAWTNAYAGAAA